jgi:small redox-active disulfide protein 2
MTVKIEVFGPGCRKCIQTERLVRHVVEELGVEADVEKVEDYQAIAAAGVLGTPAIRIDGEIKIAGRVPKQAQIEEWLRGAEA